MWANSLCNGWPVSYAGYVTSREAPCVYWLPYLFKWTVSMDTDRVVFCDVVVGDELHAVLIILVLGKLTKCFLVFVFQSEEVLCMLDFLSFLGETRFG